MSRYKYHDIVKDKTYNGTLQGKFLREYIITPEEHPSNRFHKRCVVLWMSNNGILLKDFKLGDLSIEEIEKVK